MKFKDPIDDEKYFQFRRSMGETKAGHVERRDAVIKDSPRLAVSPKTNRIYGVFVEVETGVLKAGLVMEDNTDWESTWNLPLVPSDHFGKIHNPFIAIDSLGNLCIGYEYWPDEYHPEVWVYDERLIISTVTPFLQKVTNGSSAVTIADRDNDVLIFYKRTTDGKLCWRARSQPPYESVWATENVVNTSGLTGDLYIDDAFLGGGSLEYEAQWIVLCVAARHANGRFSLHYVRSSNWPRVYNGNETHVIQYSLSDILWIDVQDLTLNNDLINTMEILGISWKDIPMYTMDELLTIDYAINSILWSGGVSYSVGDKPGHIDIVSMDERLAQILWTSVNDVSSPNESLVCSHQLTAIVWTSV